MGIITHKSVYCILQTKSSNIIQVNLTYLFLSVCRILLWLLCMTSLMTFSVIFALQKFWLKIQYPNHCLSFETASQIQQLLRSLWLDLPGLFPEGKRNSLHKDFRSWVNHVTLLQIYMCPDLFIAQTLWNFETMKSYLGTLYTSLEISILEIKWCRCISNVFAIHYNSKPDYLMLELSVKNNVRWRTGFRHAGDLSCAKLERPLTRTYVLNGKGCLNRIIKPLNFHMIINKGATWN